MERPEQGSKLFTAAEIDKYFWPADHAAPTSTTLHDAAAAPGSLAFILVYHGANPRWDAEQIIFVKSSLNLLPAQVQEENSGPDHVREETEQTTAVTTNTGQEVDTASQQRSNTAPEKPIAIFQQVPGSHRAKFAFHGWFTIVRYELLRPHSDELAYMLEQKFGQDGARRSAEQWRESFRKTWAVVKLQRSLLEQTPPYIQDVPQKSVNEILAESRSDASNSAVGSSA